MSSWEQPSGARQGAGQAGRTPFWMEKRQALRAMAFREDERCQPPQLPVTTVCSVVGQQTFTGRPGAGGQEDDVQGVAPSLTPAPCGRGVVLVS